MTVTTAQAPTLTLDHITKRFGSLTANDAITVDITPGRIHCLLGENGAGKSTLMNILFGLLQPDEGEIRMGDEVLNLTNPKHAMAKGIGMVHQHFMLIPVFTVAENMVLGREPGSGGLLDINSARKAVRELSERYNMFVDPDALVEDLPVGIQQRVEILKALAGGAQYLIFDEPTAVLTPQEIDELMLVMKALRDEGRAIVFITHKLREVRQVADDITVIRRGKVVGKAEPGASEAELATMMVGRSVSLKVDKKPAEPGEPRLTINELTVAAPSGQVAVDHLSLDVRGGEIVCIAGVQGNGQTELVETLLGTRTALSGTATLDGVDITRAKPAKTIKAGLGYVPEDRHRDGFIGEFSIAENLVLNNLDEFSRGGSLQLKKIADNAVARIEEFDIRAGSHTQPVRSLSGGNQQKVVLARELSRDLSLLVANQPTRGVDVGAIEFLHTRIVEERDRGTAVLLVSTELEEVESLADRIAVMYRGKIVGIVPPDTPRNVLGLMMAGISHEDALATIKEAGNE
ncbi:MULTISPECIES: ABC transporter ATP-binding protein [unclassified Tessaracoccus]|uniref:ABC transporter ATP-binding protein n=1 Tax=unclassified Tessaracoccus TaxID=2635419 RepID=UPI0009FA2392|nr:ABC transporter ATP-binding protein [Tessaracoccus sp. ZS01]MBB1509441.1 ABC transporter ATP-binding protein [Tessaracoccus sp. MC1756]